MANGKWKIFFSILYMKVYLFIILWVWIFFSSFLCITGIKDSECERMNERRTWMNGNKKI